MPLGVRLRSPGMMSGVPGGGACFRSRLVTRASSFSLTNIVGGLTTNAGAGIIEGLDGAEEGGDSDFDGDAVPGCELSAVVLSFDVQNRSFLGFSLLSILVSCDVDDPVSFFFPIERTSFDLCRDN